jgi:hypothetical integral membrane protein (TIGR02206 family)
MILFTATHTRYKKQLTEEILQEGPMLFFDENLRNFELFSGQHLVALLVIATIIVLIFVFKKPLQANPKLDRRLRIGFAVTMLVMEWIFYLWVILPGGFTLELLPLGLCSMSMYLSCIMLFTNNEKLFKIIYPWAVGGALLSLLVADVGFRFPHFRYFHYFGNHGMFFIANIYLAVVKGYRLSYRELMKSCGVLLVLATVIYFINLLLGTNHMFLSELPAEVAFLFLWMGDPWWIFGFAFAIFALFHLVWLPFLIHPRIRQSST